MSATDFIPLPALLSRRLQSVGIDARLLLREAKLPPDLLSGMKARVSTAGFFSLWRALERLDGDPALGLRLACEVTHDQLDVASMAALHAQSFGDALAKFARYKRLVCPEEVRVSQDGDEALVAFRWLLTQERPPARLIDACFASVLLLARTGTGLALQPQRIEFARPEADRGVLEAHFGCAAHFGASIDRIVFDAAALALPFRTANADLLQVLSPGLEAALQSLPNEYGDAPFVEQVRSAIRTQIQGQRPMVETVAAALALSSRSLQRRLSERGTSYQQLLDDERQQIARTLLETTDLNNGEIAFLLGYEELNSFNRAFAVWEGTSPMRWRQRLHASATLEPQQ